MTQRREFNARKKNGRGATADRNQPSLRDVALLGDGPMILALKRQANVTTSLRDGATTLLAGAIVYLIRPGCGEGCLGSAEALPSSGLLEGAASRFSGYEARFARDWFSTTRSERAFHHPEVSE